MPHPVLFYISFFFLNILRQEREKKNKKLGFFSPMPLERNISREKDIDIPLYIYISDWTCQHNFFFYSTFLLSILLTHLLMSFPELHMLCSVPFPRFSFINMVALDPFLPFHMLTVLSQSLWDGAAGMCPSRPPHGRSSHVTSASELIKHN